MEIYNQPTFNKGMVSVRQKNASDLSNAYDLVTWCENFTPNKIIGSLVKRSGLIPYKYTYRDSARSFINKFINMDNNTGISNLPATYSCGNNSGSVNLSALGGNIEDLFAKDKLIGVFELSTSRPVATKVPIVMFSDYEDSYVASYYVRQSGTEFYTQWNETYNMPNLDMIDEHKNRIHGIISDYDNIGEIVLFVSKKDSITHYSYPVYVYAYNDGKRDIEHWLKPDNTPEPLDAEYWHIRMNSRQYKFDIGMEQLEILNKFIFKYENDVFKTIVGQHFMATVRNDWFNANHKGYLEQQSETLGNQSMGLRTAGYRVEDVSNAISVVFFQSGELPFGSSGNNTYNSQDDFYATIQALENTDWLPYENTMGYCRDIREAGEPFGHMRTGFPFNNRYENDTNSIAVPIKPLQVKYKGKTDDDIETKVYVMRGWASHIKNGNGTNENQLSQFPSFESSFGQYPAPAFYRYNADRFPEDDPNQIPKNDVIIRTMLPKYLGQGIPRPYLAGEKIPYVLTAVINGTETELYRDVYTVREGNKRSISDKFLDGTAVYPDGENIRLYQDSKILNSKPARRFQEAFNVNEICWSNTGDAKTMWTDNGGARYADRPYPATYVDKKGNRYSQGLRGQRVLMPSDTINGKYCDIYSDSGEQWKPTVNGDEVFFQNYDATPEAGYIYFTLKINASSYADALQVLPDGITEFKLYFAEGDATNGLVKYTDEGVVWNYSTQGYLAHRATAEDSHNYRLVKRFLVSNNEGIKDVQYSAINQSTQGLSGYESTNSWIVLNSDYGAGKGIYAVPTHWRNAQKFDEIPHNGVDSSFENRVLNFHNLSTPANNNINANDDYFGDLLYQRLYGFALQDEIDMNRWSSDFCLWDYPTASTRLSENVTEEIWDGVGAGLICNVNGMIVIGDLQNKDLTSDDGIVRYTSIKNNVILTDIFPTQNKYRIGKERHTALINWREQLIAFYDGGFYKVMTKGIDPTNWLIADKFVGQGVSCKKHTVITPQGIIFMNGNGVFVTDGQSIQEISTPIENIYKTFMSKEDHGTNILSPYNFDSGKPSSGYARLCNNNLSVSEIVYDNVYNDVVIIIKDASQEYGSNWILELVFNLGDKNWIIRSHGKEINTTDTNTSYSCLTKLRSHFCGSEGLSWIRVCDINNQVNGNNIFSSWLSFFQYSSLIESDIYTPEIILDTNLGTNYIFDYNPQVPKFSPIWGAIITDTIGDGISDHSAFKLEMAGIPMAQKILSDIGEFESLFLVNRPNMNYGSQHNFVDLFTVNFRNNWKRWILKNSPSNTAPALTGISNPNSRESYVYNIPHGQMFRRCQLYYQGYELYYLESLLMMYNKQVRRYG